MFTFDQIKDEFIGEIWTEKRSELRNLGFRNQWLNDGW